MEEYLTAGDMKKADLETWLNDYGTSLLRMCFLYLKDAQMAEDAVQETMANAYFKYEDFRNESSVKTWLTRIAINRCKDYRRSMWFRNVSCVEPAELVGTENHRNIGDEVSEEAEINQKNKDLIKAVMKLPVKYREVVLLYYYQELSTKETAGVLDVPESTVSTRLRRAKQALKKELGGWQNDEKCD